MQQLQERKKIENIDFNIDLAQSFGMYKNTSEYSLLDYASSVNISCGFHAGDPMSVKEALLKAKEKNVVVGAHIGFNDIQGFGYRETALSDDELEALVIYQVGALMSFAKTYKLEIEHVRPHGAMYKKAGEDFRFASLIARAMKKCSQWLVYYGPAGNITESVGEAENVQIAQEIFLDKAYNADGTLNWDENSSDNIFGALNRLKTLLATSKIDNVLGGMTLVNADTVHFSSRTVNAQALIKQANDIIKPVPVNYKNVYASGWVE